MGTSYLEPNWEDVVGNQGLALEGRGQFCWTESLTCGVYTKSGRLVSELSSVVPSVLGGLQKGSWSPLDT